MTLQVACLDCVRYDASDPLAKCLALISSAPYLAIFYQASVAYSRRELHGITNLAGLCLNWPLGGALKHTLHQARPLATCQLLDTCHKHGMPSSHAQLMFFAWALHALFVHGGWHPSGIAASPERMLHGAEIMFLGITSCAVAFARVYLGYHDIWQVAAGAVLGTAFAVLWYWITIQLARRYFGTIQRWSVSDFLRLKDTMMVPSLLQRERQQALRLTTPEEAHEQ